MRCVTYAGETVITTDDVAASLIELTAAIAREGQSEAVSIPIVTEAGKVAQAELVIGVGNDVLSAPPRMGRRGTRLRGLRRRTAPTPPVSASAPAGRRIRPGRR